MKRQLICFLVIFFIFFSGLFSFATAATLKKTDQLILNSTLFDAIRKEKVNLTKKILKSGGDPNSQEGSLSTLGLAVIKRNPQLVKLLMEYGFKLREKSDVSQSLCIAAQNYDLEIIKLLVEGGCDINSRGENGYTPLFHACSYFKYRKKPKQGYLTIQYLISYGADINAEMKIYANRKEASLCEAVKCDDPKLIKLFLNYGANINIRDHNHSTPLIKSTESTGKNSGKISKILLNYAADPNVSDKNDNTPLYNALHQNDPDLELIKILIEKGAKPGIKEFQKALEENNPDLLILFGNSNPDINFTKIHPGKSL